MLQQMDALRSSIISSFHWLLHDTARSRLDQIKLQGLKPSRQSFCPQVIVERFGETARSILCLHPVGSFPVGPSFEGPKVRLALRSEKLPKLLSLDWSHSSSLPLADVILSECPNKSYQDIFLEVVRRHGTFAIYDAIPPNLLKVSGHGDDPATWPDLVTAQVKDNIDRC